MADAYGAVPPASERVTMRENDEASRFGSVAARCVVVVTLLAATFAGTRAMHPVHAAVSLDAAPGASGAGGAPPTVDPKTESIIQSHSTAKGAASVPETASGGKSSSSTDSCSSLTKQGACQTTSSCQWRSSDATCITKSTATTTSGDDSSAAKKKKPVKTTSSAAESDGSSSSSSSSSSSEKTTRSDGTDSTTTQSSSTAYDTAGDASADSLAPTDAGSVAAEDDDKPAKLATAANGPLGDDDDVATPVEEAAVGGPKPNATGFDAPSRSTGAGANGVQPSDPFDLGFSVSNEYTERGDAPSGTGYKWMADFYSGGIVEPHRETKLIATGAMDFDPMDGTSLNYLWTVVSNISVISGGGPSARYFIGDRSETMQYIGQEAIHTFTKVGEASRISLTELAANGFDMGGASRRSAHAIVVCKYVRRELRRLTDDDRELFFETLAVLYSVHTSAGQKMFGGKYKAAHDFIELHNTLSGQDDCDHLHGGLGFLTQHAAMTRSFEISMQAVHPEISMPYWDYSIDSGRAAMALKRDASTDPMKVWYASEVFDDDWFGPASPDAHAIDTGRFAYTPVRKHEHTENASVLPGFPLVTNAYGLTRSPWNMNRVPYVTRHNQSYGFPLDYTILPGCADMYNQMLQPLWSQFGQSIQYSPHGSLHIAIGGTWGADYASFLTKNDDFNYRFSKAQPMGTITMARTWRSGWLSCPSKCSWDTPIDDCKCSCAHAHEYINMNRSAEILSHMYPSLAAAHHFTLTDEGDDISDILLRLVCNDYHSMTPQVGDFMESASPADPLFWPTHPTLDRLWHWRAIQGFSDMSWGEASDCWGHNMEDVTVWRKGFDAVEWDGSPSPEHPVDEMLLGSMGLASGESSLSTDNGYYTNAELYAKFDAGNRELTYVYDTFEWEHCAKEGYPSDLVFAPSTPDGDDKPMGIAGAPTDDGEYINH